MVLNGRMANGQIVLGFAGMDGASATLAAGPLVLISTTNSSYDSLGRASGSTYNQARWSRDDYMQSGSAGFTHTFANTFEARESYLEKKVTGTSTNSNYKATTTTSSYDAFGRRIEVKDETTLKDYDLTLTRLRYFSYDAEGGILTRRDGELKDGKFTQATAGYSQPYDLNQHYAYANGHQVARYNEANQVDAISGLTAYDQGGAISQATVQAGDTLGGLAQRIYGNASLWYVLAAANGLASDSELVAGTTLKAPSVDVSSNNASTFKPYNPEEVIGPTQPSLPYIKPPPAAGCSAGTIIMVVVMIIVTIYTAGAASGAVGLTSSTTTAAGVAGTSTTVSAGTAALAGGTATVAGVTTTLTATSGLALATSTGCASAVAAGIGAFAGSIAGQLVG